MVSKHQSRRNYRGYRYPIPIDGYEMIDVCLRIPNHPYYRAALRGQLRALTQFYSWYSEESGADLEERWSVARIWLDAIEETLSVGEDCMTHTQVRQNEDEPCILEYSEDGGETWIPFADNSLCVVQVAEDVWSIMMQNLAQATLYKTIYDGTPGSINPNAPTGTWGEGGDQERLDALCMAAMSLVGATCALTLQEINKQYLGLAICFSALLLLSGGVAALGIGIVVGLLAGVPLEVARAALSDRNAQLAVACCMYEALKTAPVTQVAFAASLDSCGFVGGSNEMIVRDFVWRSIQLEETYLAMIDVAGRAYIQRTVLGVNLCECGDCGILTFDNPGSDLPYVILYGGLGGEGNPALCLHAEEVPHPPFPHGRRLELTITLPEVMTITKVSADWYHVNTGFPTGELGRGATLLDSAEVELANWYNLTPTVQSTWFNDSLTGAPVPNVKYIRVLGVFFCDCPGTREIRCDNIRVFCS